MALRSGHNNAVEVESRASLFTDRRVVSFTFVLDFMPTPIGSVQFLKR